MNPVYDFSADDHATMLGDQVRLEAYHRAITQLIKPGMVVAEIGTGTGILSAYAASKTEGPVYAIEYYQNTADMARAMMKAAGLNQVRVLQGESYGITLSPEPEVLITETIGAIGPEEHIVEICHDFKKRHPKLKTFIPSKLRICAEPITSRKVRALEQEYYDYFSSASFGTFNYESIYPELARIWSSVIRFSSLGDAHTQGEAKTIVNYELGVTEVSAFETIVDFSHVSEMDAVHLYFETKLDEDVLLTTHYSDPETHWRHAFVSKPKGLSRLKVFYTRASDRLAVTWEE